MKFRKKECALRTIIIYAWHRTAKFVQKIRSSKTKKDTITEKYFKKILHAFYDTLNIFYGRLNYRNMRRTERIL